MNGKGKILNLVFLSLVLILAGGFFHDIALTKENSKLTIAYMADGIGRIEPCG